MRFGQLSLRTLLLVIVPLVGVVLVARGAGPKELVSTDSPYDLAIEGLGYFCVTDELGENEEHFVRGGTLNVNANGQLRLRAGSVQGLIYPNITLPSDTQQLLVTDDGRVLVMQGGQVVLSQQGQIPLYTFNADNIPDLVGPVVTRTDETGPPIENQPGIGKAGLVRQGFREEAPLAFEGKSIGFLLAGLVLGWLATVRRR